MTEGEAKTKWCPMVRFHVGANQGVYDNKPGDTERCTPQSAFCIGSDCMMWRTKPIAVDGKYAGYDGHCGLAGKP